jgi:hypothetical protein
MESCSPDLDMDSDNGSLIAKHEASGVCHKRRITMASGMSIEHIIIIDELIQTTGLNMETISLATYRIWKSSNCLVARKELNDMSA